ncbi:PREDICTED: cytochrome P450 89A2-like [Lupinus angustifolius]|nr:PREDICTED: cytochrome P450 89A2-like [Lupinus angustifolius]
MQNSNMEIWFILIILCLLLLIILKTVGNLFFSHPPLPPGPAKFPIIGNITLLQFVKDPETLLRNLQAKYGPIFTLHIGSQTAIFIADRFLAHQALIQNGTNFADRPKPVPTNKIISSNQHDIVFSFYGPLWRLLRRNLTSRILHPSQYKSYAHARKWTLHLLLDRFKCDVDADNSINYIEHFRYGMFCLLVFMCLGDKLDEKQIREIEDTQRQMLVKIGRYSVLNLWPPITTILFRKRLQEFLQLRRDQEAALIPHINARRKLKEERVGNIDKENNDSDKYIESYVDTLLDLELLEEGSKLDNSKICTLCAEFLNAGTDTTATALEWIMANLVKYQDIQERIVEEIKGVMGEREDKEVKEEDLQKMPYLKAVILEGLRLHPPVHFLAPHRVTEDAVLNGYSVPSSATIYFIVAEIGKDPTAWDDPMSFKPERFMFMNDEDENGDTTFDIMGSKEIKMLPFGAGRRMCPGYALGILHLEYFVANFVWNFKWKTMGGDHIDMSEKLQFTSVMKNPLKVHLVPRL